MPNSRQLFLSHVAQTSELPMMLEIDRAEGMFIYTTDGKRYYDMNSGISVSSVGHSNPEVLSAVHEQLDRYMHTMVYGEYILTPQVGFAELLTSHLDESLNSVYFLNGGSEAIEGAMKLAKRLTGRAEIIACSNAYHGSTQGAESLRSDHEYSQAFLPLLPGVRHIHFNDIGSLEKLSRRTSCVILELVQAEAGVLVPDPDFLKALVDKCKQHEILLIADEIQTGFGRTGHLFAHQKYGLVPDVLVIGKSMGGGMPLSAFVSSKENMMSLTNNPNLGHLTTFGGHPVCCAAALASLKFLLKDDLIKKVLIKEKLIHETLKHPIIKEIRSSGLMMAVELSHRKYLKHVVANCLENGLIIDWFLFNNRSFRLAPPLIISEEQIKEACQIILNACNYAEGKYRK